MKKLFPADGSEPAASVLGNENLGIGLLAAAAVSKLTGCELVVAFWSPELGIGACASHTLVTICYHEFRDLPCGVDSSLVTGAKEDIDGNVGAEVGLFVEADVVLEKLKKGFTSSVVVVVVGEIFVSATSVFPLVDEESIRVGCESSGQSSGSNELVLNLRNEKVDKGAVTTAVICIEMPDETLRIGLLDKYSL